jgi:hypothetical protein
MNKIISKCKRKHAQVYVEDFDQIEDSNKAKYMLYDLDQEQKYYSEIKINGVIGLELKLIRSGYSLLIRQCEMCNIFGISIVRRTIDNKYRVRIKYFTKMLFFDLKELDKILGIIWELELDLEQTKLFLQRYNVEIRF